MATMTNDKEKKDWEDRKRREALARSQTDPLFLQDHFLVGGHDVDTKNATATFVQFERKQYAVTCRHVLEVMVGAPCVLLAAQKKGEIDRDRKFAEMHSRLEKPHGYYFSGMSGGAMYVIQDDVIIPMAIVFEGWPQSRNSPPHPTLNGNDIYIRGLTLTPVTFANWLARANLRKS